ncbi:MAG TPA: NUDIX domain-containing protein [Candidatus Saccharimonadales bacterium]|nr:NUDIX domain-containing protein [Candidatus Saccharimonadales bacterium]
MKQLLTLRDEDVFTDAKNLTPDGWFTRNAARAVLFSDTGEVYLLKMSARHYHKLPGGGVNEGEPREDALYRELLEEVGCPATIESELGEIVEYRNGMQMEQHSYCYIARQSAPLGETALEEGELEEGAETVVAKNIDEAIALLENDEPTNYGGHFIRQRDLCFLREAKARVNG